MNGSICSFTNRFFWVPGIFDPRPYLEIDMYRLDMDFWSGFLFVVASSSEFVRVFQGDVSFASKVLQPMLSRFLVQKNRKPWLSFNSELQPTLMVHASTPYTLDVFIFHILNTFPTATRKLPGTRRQVLYRCRWRGKSLRSK